MHLIMSTNNSCQNRFLLCYKYDPCNSFLGDHAAYFGWVHRMREWVWLLNGCLYLSSNPTTSARFHCNLVLDVDSAREMDGLHHLTFPCSPHSTCSNSRTRVSFGLSISILLPSHPMVPQGSEAMSASPECHAPNASGAYLCKLVS